PTTDRRTVVSRWVSFTSRDLSRSDSDLDRKISPSLPTSGTRGSRRRKVHAPRLRSQVYLGLCATVAERERRTTGEESINDHRGGSLKHLLNIPAYRPPRRNAAWVYDRTASI